jgi:hypothetical protein
MSKHTPGPWVVSHGYDGSISVDTVDYVRLNLTTACKIVVADICKHEMAEHFSAEANARLIAAAPELLEALQDVCARLLYRGVSTDAGHPDRTALEVARAAIAKATGEKA